MSILRIGVTTLKHLKARPFASPPEGIYTQKGSRALAAKLLKTKYNCKFRNAKFFKELFMFIDILKCKKKK